jgi:hypothetical protein
MMLDAEAVKGWTWKEVLRGKINSQRRNRHHNARIFDDELKSRLGDKANTWDLIVAQVWEEEEEAWKKKLGNDPARIDARASERKPADDNFIRETGSFFDHVQVAQLPVEHVMAMHSAMSHANSDRMRP